MTRGIVPLFFFYPVAKTRTPLARKPLVGNKYGCDTAPWTVHTDQDVKT